MNRSTRDDTRRVEHHDGVTLIIEETRPENQPGALAVEKAHTYETLSVATKEAADFEASEHLHRRLAGDTTFYIRKMTQERELRKREDESRAAAGLPPVERLRMDPVVDFDMDAAVKQRRDQLDTAQECRRMADKAHTRCAELRVQIAELDRRLAAANAYAASNQL